MAASSTAVAAAAQQHPAAIRRLEAQAAAAAVQPLAEALAQAQAAATQRWLHSTSAAQPAPTEEALAKLIAAVRTALATAFRGQGSQAQRAIQRAAFTAAQLGAQQASSLAADMTDTRPPGVQPVIGPDAKAAADSAPAAVEEEHQGALALLTTASLTALGLSGLLAIFNRAKRAIGRITRSMAVAVTSAAAWGVTAIARAIGPTVRLLWVTEPGACPACTAYAGRSILPGQKFPGGLSLDPRRTRFPTAISGPPRHVHCRCALVVYLPEWHTGGTPLPLLLRRHARAGGR
ncbi:hypothetical protein [Streptomyces sp. NBC_01716]|uniref:hypothetical protein n=1 Tax=Streptomyces sp. NBC_01716 TaxID=2975917 RepID=UPI002E2FA610|nr:hypothetical protein [Streptomyces sp. NBC_01716]